MDSSSCSIIDPDQVFTEQKRRFGYRNRLIGIGGVLKISIPADIVYKNTIILEKKWKQNINSITSIFWSARHKTITFLTSLRITHTKSKRPLDNEPCCRSDGRQDVRM